MSDRSPLDTLLHDMVRLLPDDDRTAVLQGVRLRRQALALARRQGIVPSPEAVRRVTTAFRRARGLTRAHDLTAWCQARDLSPEDFARLMTEEATLAAMGDTSDPSASEIVDYLRVAEGSETLWQQARALRECPPNDASPIELLHAWYETRLGMPVPDEARIERDAHLHGFDDLEDLLRALARTTRPTGEPPAALARGDTLPDFVLRHPDAGDIRPDLFAGRWWVLVLGELHGGARVAHALSGFEGLIVDEGGASAAGVTLPDTWSAVPDLARTLRTRCRFPSVETVAMLVTPAGRVADVVHDVTSVSFAPRFERARHTWQGGHAPVLLVPEAFEASLCEALIHAWEHGAREAGRVTTDGDAGPHAHVALDIKRRTDHLLRDTALEARIRDRLARRVLPEMRRAFGYDTFRCEGFRVGCYDARDGGAFGPHRDDANPTTAKRRFALSVNLRHGDYTGGRLTLPEYGASFDAPTGAALVYGAGLLHEVEPVTAGRRFALVGFFL